MPRRRNQIDCEGIEPDYPRGPIKTAGKSARNGRKRVFLGVFQPAIETTIRDAFATASCCSVFVCERVYLSPAVERASAGMRAKPSRARNLLVMMTLPDPHNVRPKCGEEVSYGAYVAIQRSSPRRTIGASLDPHLTHPNSQHSVG